MGKIRKAKKPKKPSPPEAQEPMSILTQMMPEQQRDFDVGSVRSLKSFKNKFGIKRQITKSDKLKLRKEILKQKIDYVKDQVGPARPKHQKAAKPTSDQVRTFAKDEDEEYVKLSVGKVKAIPKKKQRAKQTAADVRILKALMSGKN